MIVKDGERHGPLPTTRSDDDDGDDFQQPVKCLLTSVHPSKDS